METHGLKIADYKGLHNDDWCEQKVVLRVVSDCQSDELRLGVWVKPESRKSVSSKFKVVSSGQTVAEKNVKTGEPTEISIPVSVFPGFEVSFEIHSDNSVKKAGKDNRKLSFKMTSLSFI